MYFLCPIFPVLSCSHGGCRHWRDGQGTRRDHHAGPCPAHCSSPFLPTVELCILREKTGREYGQGVRLGALLLSWDEQTVPDTVRRHCREDFKPTTQRPGRNDKSPLELTATPQQAAGFWRFFHRHCSLLLSPSAPPQFCLQTLNPGARQTLFQKILLK